MNFSRYLVLAWKKIYFVPNLYVPILQNVLCNTNLFENRQYCASLVIGEWMRDVTHMDQNISSMYLVKGRFEALDEAVRKVSDEADCVKHQSLLTIG